MRFKTIDNFNFDGKRVLVRIDLNSEVIKGKVTLSERFMEHAKTIKELIKKKAKVVVLAHQSRPGKKNFMSLKQHAKLLNRFVRIKFVDDVIGRRAVSEIRKLGDGKALLLDNVRFLKDEFKPSTKNRLVKILRPLFDYYVNDAFSVSHRKQTSIVSFPKVLESCIGRVMEKELKSLEKIKIKNCLYILGGAKPEDSILLLKNKNVLTCGQFGQICLIAKGYNLGAQNKFLKDKLIYVPRIRKWVRHVVTPIDLAVKINGKRKDLDLEEFPSEYEIFDIGPKTTRKYVEKIRKARTIFYKGTAGYCEEKKFCKGTKAILKAIEKSGAFSVVGGGHTLTALQRFRINKKRIGHVSLSGGALIDYIASRKLAGLEALKNA